MTHGYFARNLMDLLPPLYRIADESGDLQAFLNVVAPTLDELKDLIDRFPGVFDVDRCEERYLPLLAGLVGLAFDATADPQTQRRRLKEAIAYYQRRGSIPAIGRALTDVGWTGELEETFRQTLRLGSRSVLNRAKIPGLIYSLGVYRVGCLNQTSGLRQALIDHHPAGALAFFRQWLLSSADASQTAVGKLLVRMTLFATIDEAFILNQSRLCGPSRLTFMNASRSSWCLTTWAAAETDFDEAYVRLASWHGRGDRMRLNQSGLGKKMLANCWESERKYAITCQVQARRLPPKRVAPMILNREDLCEARLNTAYRPCRVEFKKRDYYAEVDASLTAAANHLLITQWPSN